MKTNILVAAMAAFAVTTTTSSAADFDLRANMLKMNAELAEVTRGFMKSDKVAVGSALDLLAADVNNLLSDEGLSYKKRVYDMFPEEMANKKHKVGIAMKAGREMKQSIEKIREMIADETSTQLTRKRTAQEAYAKIVGACFECHNLVRDKNN